MIEAPKPPEHFEGKISLAKAYVVALGSLLKTLEGTVKEVERTKKSRATEIRKQQLLELKSDFYLQRDQVGQRIQALQDLLHDDLSLDPANFTPERMAKITPLIREFTKLVNTTADLTVRGKR